MKQILLSKLQSSTVFDVDRLTIYNWIRKGCPVVDLGGPGRPAKLDFQAVLRWRKDDLTQSIARQWDSSNESIKYIAEMEAAVRQRLKVLKLRRRVCK